MTWSGPFSWGMRGANAAGVPRGQSPAHLRRGGEWTGVRDAGNGNRPGVPLLPGHQFRGRKSGFARCRSLGPIGTALGRPPLGRGTHRHFGGRHLRRHGGSRGGTPVVHRAESDPAGGHDRSRPASSGHPLGLSRGRRGHRRSLSHHRRHNPDRCGRTLHHRPPAQRADRRPSGRHCPRPAARPHALRSNGSGHLG